MATYLDTSALDAWITRLETLASELETILAETAVTDIAAHWSVNSPASPDNPPAIVTGNLAASVQVIEGKSGLMVGSSLEYAAALEYGTADMPPRPWLRPAIERIRAQLLELAQQTIMER